MLDRSFATKPIGTPFSNFMMGEAMLPPPIIYPQPLILRTSSITPWCRMIIGFNDILSQYQYIGIGIHYIGISIIGIDVYDSFV